MTKLKFALLGLTVFSIAVPPNAYAACQKDGLLVCGAGSAQIASDDGLQVSRGGEFAPLASGSGLKTGDRVLIGRAKATLALGPSCSTPVGAGSMVFILPSGDKTCASVAPQGLADMKAQAGSNDPSFLPPPTGGLSPTIIVLGLAGTAALGVGIAVAVSGGGSQYTPVSGQ